MRTIRLRNLPNPTRGLGLVELLVALGVVGVLVAVALPAMSDFLERRRVIAVAGEILNIMAYAKAETNAIRYGVNVHMETDPNNHLSCVAVVTQTLGDDCKCYYSAAQICPLSGKLLRLFQLPRADNVTFAATATTWGGLTQVVSFNHDKHDQVEQNVRITVTGLRSGVELRIELNEAGRAKICSPSGRVGGYATCV